MISSYICYHNSNFFRIDKCPEVQILDLKSRCSVNVLDCPTVHMIENF